MDCRLQIAELEARLKSFEATKRELGDCQAQCDRIRIALENSEAKLEDAERRADEATGLIKIKDSVILKQSNFTKEIEERLRNVTEDRDRLLEKSNNLEVDLNAAVIRGEDADELKVKVKELESLLDKLATERSETTSESGLASANEYFKAEQLRLETKIAKLKDDKDDLNKTIEQQEQDKKELLEQMDKHMDDYEKLSDKCATLEARIKEMQQSERRYGGGMMGSRLIGPTLPPWINDEKKIENDLERLSKADPATLRAKVMELESQVSELNQLLTYREDVILRIHEEIGKKASKLEAADVERSSLNAQVSILKRELATAREDLARRGNGPMELEAEIERLRGKRDREYQRRKRIETEMDELEKENQDLKQRLKRLEETVTNAPPPKPAVPQSDPSDRQRIMELQATVNQLRVDNEAKRSELFDLRSRFDAKSAQMDKIAAELKTKERSTGELTSQLNTVRSQLETTTKELENVRCRAVRGGAEAERWSSDITSLQATNKFFSTQLNEMRAQLLVREHQLADLTKRCQLLVNEQKEKVHTLVNGDTSDRCSQCDRELDIADDQPSVKSINKEKHLAEKLDEAVEARRVLETAKVELEARLQSKEKELAELKQVSEKMKIKSSQIGSPQQDPGAKEQELTDLLEKITMAKDAIEKDKVELESKLNASHLRATQLSDDVSREREVAEAANAKVQLLTSQVNDLTTSLSTTRSLLMDAKSVQRKLEADAAPVPVSPPAKRTRRSAVGAKGAAANHQDCSSCTELKRQVQELEGTISEYGSREAALTSQVNELRQQIVEADSKAADLRLQLTSVHQEMADKCL